MQTLVEHGGAESSLESTPASASAVSAARTAAVPDRMARRPELDALRGLFLVWMTLTHLPTRLSDLVNQPFGFVSSAEGFVFLSGMLVAQLSIRQAERNGSAVRAKLWKRSFHIYGYHLIMLALAFTVVAAFAVKEHASAICNLLNFYLAHPATAVAGAVFLIYCPPLLDILPLYVIFLALTPPILIFAARKGWNRILMGSGLVWLLAQFGLRTWAHALLVLATGLKIPLQEMGAFNLFAWQAIWILALWMGAQAAEGKNPLSKLPGFVFPVSTAICLFFLGVRHSWLGGHFSAEALGLSVDKWQLGSLRMLNLFAFACLIYWFRKGIARLVLVEPFMTLGKASLEVFCAHIFFVFVGLALLYGEVTQLHGAYALALVTITFASLIVIALRVLAARRLRAKTTPA